MLLNLMGLRSALRMPVKSPAFTAAAILTLAFGIGASISIFSIINEVFFRPIPIVKEQDRLVLLVRTLNGRSSEKFDYPGYLDYEARSRSFSGLIAYYGAGMNLASGSGYPVRVRAMLVSHNYFSVLGVNILRGRAFLPEENQTPDSHPVAVVSHHLWKERFGSDPNFLGQTLMLNGRAFTVVGIAAEGFVGLELDETDDIWIPFMMEDTARPLFPVLKRGLFTGLNIVGRLKPGISIKQAQAEMTVTAHALEEVNQSAKEQMTVTLSRNIRFGDPEFRAETKLLLALLMTAAVVVLLIACANVTNLMLARASSKRTETAMRLALGAGRSHLAHQFLMESMILALPGGALGIFVGIILTRLPQAYSGPKLDFSPDLRVLAFTFSLSILTGIIVALAPSLQGFTHNLVPALKDARVSGGFRSARLRSILVIFQVALSLALLVAAGLLVRTIRNLQAIDMGFETRRLLIFPFELRAQGYPETKVRQMQRELMECIKALPGVQSVSIADRIPLQGWFSRKDEILPEGREKTPSGLGLTVDYNTVTPQYFKTLGVPLISGRDFTDADKQDSSPVAIVNETMARRYWLGQDTIGRRFRIDRGFLGWSPYHEIVGVVKDTHYNRPVQKPAPHFYLPLSQNYNADVAVHVRASVDSRGMSEMLRKQVSALDPSLPPPPIRSFAEQLMEKDSDQRMIAAIVSLFSCLSLALAAIGVYTIMSYAMAQRTREIGIRMALGAERWKILKLVMGQALTVASTGIALGLIASFFLARIIANQLYGISPLDPLNLAGASGLMLVTAAVASYIPARRAMNIDLSSTLRYE